MEVQLPFTQTTTMCDDSAQLLNLFFVESISCRRKLTLVDFGDDTPIVSLLRKRELSSLEIARNLQRRKAEKQLSQEELARDVGLPRSTVANYLRLLSLPPSIQKALDRKRILFGHAKALAAIKGEELQKRCLLKVMQERLTVRQTEEIVRSEMQKWWMNRDETDVELRALEGKLEERLATKVTIVRQGTGFDLSIRFFDQMEFDSFFSLIGDL